jgi:hypothetical protein
VDSKVFRDGNLFICLSLLFHSGFQVLWGLHELVCWLWVIRLPVNLVLTVFHGLIVSLQNLLSCTHRCGDWRFHCYFCVVWSVCFITAGLVDSRIPCPYSFGPKNLLLCIFFSFPTPACDTGRVAKTAVITTVTRQCCFVFSALSSGSVGT